MTQLFSRAAAHSALLIGDQISEPPARVIAFRCDLPGGSPTERPREDYDIAVIQLQTGDLLEAPHRSACATRSSQNGFRAGTTSAFHITDEVLSDSFRQLLDRSRTETSFDILDLIRTISDAGYNVWIVGGAVRDLIGGLTSAADVNDLDLAGSIPFGALYERFLEKPRAIHGFEIRLTPTGVLHVYRSEGGERTDWFQYAFLRHGEIDAQKARNQLWFGGPLEADVKWRDLTINTLLWDPLTATVFDPTGRGIEDLYARRIVAIPPLDWPSQAAKLLFRILKFSEGTKFRNFDIGEASEFLGRMLATCCEDFRSLALPLRYTLIRNVYGTRIDDDFQLSRLANAGRRLKITDFSHWNTIMEVAINTVSFQRPRS